MSNLMWKTPLFVSTFPYILELYLWTGRLHLKCDGMRAETRFRISAKRTSPFKSVGASVQSITGNRSVSINGSNARYTMFRGSVKSTGYPLHSPVSPSLPLPCVTVYHHISSGLYHTELALNVREMTKEFIFTDTKCRFSQSENSCCYQTSNHVSSIEKIPSNQV